MPPQIKPILISIGAIGIIVGAFLTIIYARQVGFKPFPKNPGNVAEIPAELADDLRSTASVSVTIPVSNATGSVNTKVTDTQAEEAKKTPINREQAVTSPKTPTNPPESPIEQKEAQDSRTISRIENPYPFPPKSFALVNEEARAAIVNIFCAARGGSLKSTSGTGVIMDPRGVILTNAHVAQYVLLSRDNRVDLSCVMRGGSPARDLWTAEVLYIPPVWLYEHAKEIKSARAMSTGEHDYALLRIIGSADEAEIPINFPYLPIDTREAIGFIDDPILVASYPAEFLGGIASQFSLFPVSSITTIKDLLTFEFNSVDVLSLGGIIAAQSGSSGGAVANSWGRLIGVITTTSEGTTTSDRDLRALTLSYINRDMSKQTGLDLAGLLSGNIAEQAATFNSAKSPALVDLLIANIEGH
ncbi:MAG TPA: trypsin-like peptidase domain-containing protein [Candidatus Paceibacterota bacterium]